MRPSRSLILLLIALLLIVVGITTAAAAPAAQTATVSMNDFSFEPKTITVPAGTTVTWTNNGVAPHTATASDGSWDSGRLAPNGTFSQTFDTPGTYQYYCSLHGTAEGGGMAATVVVEAAASEAEEQQQQQQPSITVEDQSADGRTVTIQQVVAAEDGWLVIHDSDAEGNMLGDALGHTAVMSGTNDNVTVTLSQDVAEGKVLYPMLHVDAGTIGTYEFPGPDMPVKAGEEVVVESFTITAATTAAAPAADATPTAAGAPESLPQTGADRSLPIGLVGLAALLLLGAGLLLRQRLA